MSLEKKPFTVFIEGNIGCGKTSLLNYLQKFQEVLVLKEDVEIWSNFHGYNLLNLKFKEPEHFQFPFQSLVTLTRLRQHIKSTERPIKIIERSLFSARHCFVKAQKDLNLLHEGMFYVLEEWFDYIDEYHDIKCDLIIYIQTNPDVCYERIKERGRKEEEKITSEYLKVIHKLHEDLYINETVKLPAKVFVIDGNVTESDQLAEYKKVENEIFSSFF